MLLRQARAPRGAGAGAGAHYCRLHDSCVRDLPRSLIVCAMSMVAVLAVVAALLAPVRGPATTPPPDPDFVIGMTAGEAEVALREKWHPNAKVTLLPSAGKPGPTADLTLATVEAYDVDDPDAKEPVVVLSVVPLVPKLVGLRRAAAEKLLVTYGLAARTVPSAATDDWLVARHDPVDGSRAPFGATITLVLREPPRVRSVAVPDIRGLTVDAATTAVTAADVVISVQLTGPGEPGEVTGQRPAPGTLVPPGTTVLAIVRPIVPAPTPAPTEVDRPLPPWVPLTLVSAGGLLLLLVLLTALLLRRPRRSSRLPAVHATSRPGLIAGPTITPLTDAPDHAVRVSPRAGSTVYEELP